MSRVHHELTQIRRERARRAAATPTADTASPNPEVAIEARLEEIARTTLGLETLQTRNSDSLDVHELAVWTIKNALRAAYEAGRAHA
jgi:hypothetical protein